MKTLLLNTMLVGCISALPLSVLANDLAENYDAAYTACYDVAEETSAGDDWQSILDNCMREKGFDVVDDPEEVESHDDHNE